MAENDAEIFQRLRNIETTVVRIDERESHMISDHRDLKEQVRDHESRIRSMEQDGAKRKGFLVAIASAASVVVNAILYFVKLLFAAHNS